VGGEEAGGPRGGTVTTPGCPKKLEKCNAAHYTWAMIKTFAHKGLERFFLTASKRGASPHNTPRELAACWIAWKHR